ncbi:hypothetical protein MMC08_003258 [Hypocenomyce scalaris]|nr:hypothetical protein [Hypocenomyce scalaris]
MYSKLLRPHFQHTCAYKEINGIPLELDLYLPSAPPSHLSPVILWFHGGFLITGTRAAVPAWLLNACLRRGWPLVSADYRVMPEASALATLNDLCASYRWVSGSLPRLFPSAQADVARIILAGSSAGGWCVLACAVEIQRAVTAGTGEGKDGEGADGDEGSYVEPKAMLLLYPIADPSAERWRLRGVALEGLEIDAGQARDAFAEIEARRKGGKVSFGEAFPKDEADYVTRKRLEYLAAVVQEGPYVDFFAGEKGLGERIGKVGLQSAVLGEARKIFPLDFVDWEMLPKCVVVHAIADKDVGVEESEKLVRKLKDTRTEVEYFPVANHGHTFDLNVTDCEDGESDSDVRLILQKCLKTLDHFVTE